MFAWLLLWLGSRSVRFFFFLVFFFFLMPIEKFCCGAMEFLRVNIESICFTGMIYKKMY